MVSTYGVFEKPGFLLTYYIPDDINVRVNYFRTLISFTEIKLDTSK